MNEVRLEAIETKIVYLEDMVEDLNKTIYEQQQRLDHQQYLIDALLSQVRDLADDPERPAANEKPPHY